MFFGTVIVFVAEIFSARGGPRVPTGDADRVSRILNRLLREKYGDIKPEISLVFLGDSTTAGDGTSAPARSLVGQLALGLNRNVEVSVLARSGARISDVMKDELPRWRELESQMNAKQIGVVSIGANDVVQFAEPQRFLRRYKAFLEEVSDVHPILVIGIPDLGVVPRLKQPIRWVAGWHGARLRKRSRQVCDLVNKNSANKIVYVDIAKATYSNFVAEPERLFAADKFHPNDVGYQVWADVLLPALEMMVDELHT